MKGAFTRNHLPATCKTAKAGSCVQRGAAKAPTLGADRFARVEADTYPERKSWDCFSFLRESSLHVECRPKRLSSRVENHEGFVAPDLDHLAIAQFHGLVGDLCKISRRAVVLQRRIGGAPADPKSLCSFGQEELDASQRTQFSSSSLMTRVVAAGPPRMILAARAATS